MWIRFGLVSLVVLAGLGCASAPATPAPAALAAPAAPAAPAPRAARERFVTLRGPEEIDCPADLEAARAAGEASSLFLTELKCRVHPAWKCRESCKGDELMVTHLHLAIGRDGALAGVKVVQPSGRSDFDEMSVAAVQGGAPFSPPPGSLIDSAGVFPLNVELAC